MEDNKPKKSNYFRFGILIFLWLLLIGGLSYAYFSIVFDDDEHTSAVIESGKLSVDFVTDEYINNEDMWPINDEDIFTSGDISEFSVTRSANNTTDNVYYNIYLDDIIVSSNYKSSYIKWKLYDVENPTELSTPISQGNFLNIGNDTSLQLNNSKISLPKNVTHYYTLYLWISNSTSANQLELLEGSIEGKIKIVAVTE